MARGINKAILIGNLGNDPEVRQSSTGNAITTLTIATSETWVDKQTGNKQEQTEWHRVVCFNRLGEIAGEYLKKGSKVYIEGKIRTRKWQDQQGQDRYTTEIVANELQMLDSKGGNQGNQSSGLQGYDELLASSGSASSFTPNAAPKAQESAAPQEMFSALNDDIPF